MNRKLQFESEEIDGQYFDLYLPFNKFVIKLFMSCAVITILLTLINKYLKSDDSSLPIGFWIGLITIIIYLILFSFTKKIQHQYQVYCSTFAISFTFLVMSIIVQENFLRFSEDTLHNIQSYPQFSQTNHNYMVQSILCMAMMMVMKLDNWMNNLVILLIKVMSMTSFHIRVIETLYSYDAIFRFLQLFTFLFFMITMFYTSEKFHKSIFIKLYKKIKKVMNDETILKSCTHDLKSPVSSILHIVNVNLEKLGIPFTQKHYLNDIKCFLIKQQNLIQDLVDYSELKNFDSSDLYYQLLDFDISVTLNQAREYFFIMAQIKGVVIEFHFNFRQLIINSDEKKLIQVLDNIIGNSTKFSPDGNIHVYINHFQQSNLIYFQITDDGVGIDKETIPLIQTKFKTINENNMNPSGSGLGLFLSKIFVNKLGPCQKMVIQSEKGLGTCFSFLIYMENQEENQNQFKANSVGDHNHLEIIEYLKSQENENNQLNIFDWEQFVQEEKLRQQIAEELKIEQQNSHQITLQNFSNQNIDLEHQDQHENPDQIQTSMQNEKTNLIQIRQKKPQFNILIVDDDDFQMGILKENYFKNLQCNYEINLMTALSGQQAIDYFTKHNSKDNNEIEISLIITDISMPLMNGFEASKQIKDKVGSYYDDTYILAYSGHKPTNIFKKQIKEAKIDRYLEKPTSKNQFVSFIIQLMDQIYQNKQ